MARQLMYFWTLLHKEDAELVKRALEVQQLLPLKNYRVLQLKSDLADCHITLSEESIKYEEQNLLIPLSKSKSKLC